MSDKTNTKKTSDKLIKVIKIKECYEDEALRYVQCHNCGQSTDGWGNGNHAIANWNAVITSSIASLDRYAASRPSQTARIAFSGDGEKKRLATI